MTNVITTSPGLAVDRADLEQGLEACRAELTRYCRWRLRSTADAEDAVQETLLRAWRALDRFQGRATLRTWLFRIASNVCFDILVAQRRHAAVDVGAAAPVDDTTTEPVSSEDDPGEAAVVRDDLRLAFVATLLHLPPRQRAVLILCDALRWRASEAAELLGMSVVAVNSARQRARAAVAAIGGPGVTRNARLDAEQHRLVDHYLDALERDDFDGLAALLRNPSTNR